MTLEYFARPDLQPTSDLAAAIPQTPLADGRAAASNAMPLVRLPGGHYEGLLGGHEQGVETQLSFLRRHLLDGAHASVAEATR